MQQINVENEFVNVIDLTKNNPNEVRKSHIVRQIEEGVLGVQKDDYDDQGNLDLNKLAKRDSMRKSLRKSNVSDKK